jgi:hypothetical protein
LETFRQAGDFVEYVQFLAILDSRTTAICESRHGRMMRLDSPELAANTPPLHYQCRSLLSPVTRFDLRDMEKPGWKDEEGKSFEELLDWGKVSAPQKGFGEIGKVLQKQERSLPQPANRRIPPVMKKLDEEGTQKEFTKGEVRILIRGFREGEEALIESAFNKVPVRDLADLKAVSVVNNPIIIIRNHRPKLARAAYDPPTSEIEINRKLVDLVPRKKGIETESRRTVLHEIGHHFYNKNVSELSKQEFKDIATKKKLTLFKNKYEDAIEFFAGAYIEWHEQHRALAKKCPEVYTILERIFKEAR